jgi:hypothetical protein
MYMANKEDKKSGRVIIKQGKEIHVGDTVEDVMYEIMETQNELTTIEHTQTPGTNRDHWDTPEIKKAGGRKGRMRKDRYSALLLANMAARQLLYAPTPTKYAARGGFAKDVMNESGSEELKNMPLYQAPDWFLNPKEYTGPYQYGIAVKRRN